MKQIQCKFVPQVLMPRNAFDGFNDDYQTKDGRVCSLEFLVCWKNTDDQCKDELDDTAQRIHGCSFDYIRSLWIGRLGHADEFWYLINLKEK